MNAIEVWIFKSKGAKRACIGMRLEVKTNFFEHSYPKISQNLHNKLTLRTKPYFFSEN